MAAVEQVGSAGLAGRRAPSHGVVSRVVGYATMVVVVFIIGLPLLWLVSAAFKETSEIYVVPASWIPHNPILSNFPNAWNAADPVSPSASGSG